MGHQFLTKDWFGEVARIHEEIKPPISGGAQRARHQLEDRGRPGGDIEARMEGGTLREGLAESAPTTLKICDPRPTRGCPGREDVHASIGTGRASPLRSHQL